MYNKQHHAAVLHPLLRSTSARLCAVCSEYPKDFFVSMRGRDLMRRLSRITRLAVRIGTVVY